MSTRWQVVHAEEVVRYDEQRLTNTPLFAEEEFSGVLLGFLPGQSLPRHRHAHEHEVFDVSKGTGSMWLDGEAVEAGPGTTVFVPSGVEHGFENTGREHWLIRATFYQRTYARQAFLRALRKRLGRAAR